MINLCMVSHNKMTYYSYVYILDYGYILGYTFVNNAIHLD